MSWRQRRSISGHHASPPHPAAPSPTDDKNGTPDEGKTDAVRRNLEKGFRSPSPPPPRSFTPTPVTIGKKAHVHHHRNNSSYTLDGNAGDDEEEAGDSYPLALPRLPPHQTSSTGSNHGRRASAGGGGGGGGMGHGHGSTSSLSALGEISRQLSQSFQMSLDLVKAHLGEELVYCQICREYEGNSATFKMSACGHRFCKECVASYLECKIREGQIFPLCFYSEETDAVMNHTSRQIPKPCATSVNETDIKALVCDETWAKYERFKFAKEHRNARACPYCEGVQLGDPSRPEMLCSACKKTFCYFHSSAHVGKSCTEYEKETHEENLKNQALISTIAKPCPGCGSPVEKAGGCNQMKCSTCGSHFCWLCGKIVAGDTFPNHFQWWNLSGCPNMQMQEDIEPPPPTYIRMVKCLSLLEVLIIGPAALVLGLAFYLLCFPCFFGKWLRSENRLQSNELCVQFTGCVSFWGNTLVALLCFPLFIAMLLVFFLVTFIQVLITSIAVRFGGLCCYQGQKEEENKRGGTRQQEQEQQQPGGEMQGGEGEGGTVSTAGGGTLRGLEAMILASSIFGSFGGSGGGGGSAGGLRRMTGAAPSAQTMEEGGGGIEIGRR